MARGWLSGRSVAAFAGGSVAALLASRLLPPLLAQAAGTARPDPFDALAEDHRHFLSLLERMEDSPDGAALQRTQLLLRLKRGLAKHALAEEDVIYPLLHGREPALGDTDELYAEHGRIKILLHGLEQMPKDDHRWAMTAGELRRLIEDHARHEEEVEFPYLRRLLDEQGARRLSGQVQREKALIL